jgi:S1-C subfamily serine protease
MMNEIDAASPLKFTKMSGITFGASDHASFMTKKIPALFLFSGLHPDYHRPTDDVEKINFEGIATVVDVSEEIVRSLAVMPRQKFVGASPRRPASTEPASTQEVRPQLGIVPSYSEDENAPEGIKLNGTIPGTAAEAAGLKEGDVIQVVNGKRMTSLEDLMPMLESAKVGDKLTLHVLRGKEVIDLEATLKARQRD